MPGRPSDAACVRDVCARVCIVARVLYVCVYACAWCVSEAAVRLSGEKLLPTPLQEAQDSFGMKSGGACRYFVGFSGIVSIYFW